MGFQVTTQLADRISKGENGGRHQMPVQMCIPYRLGVKRRYGFCRVTYKAMIDELAAERTRGLPCEEIATVLGKTAQQCRALRRHDVSLIRDHIGPHFATKEER